MTSTMIAPEAHADFRWECGPSFPGGIVVAIDGSPESIAALNSAATMAANRGCKVHAVSVLPPFGSYRSAPELDESRSEVESLRVNIREVAIRNILDKANPGNKWTHEVVTGPIAEEVVQAAEHWMADLIVIGCRHQSEIENGLESETTQQVINMSSIPVLTVESDLDGIKSTVVAADLSLAGTRACAETLASLGGRGTLYMENQVNAGSDDKSDVYQRPRFGELTTGECENVLGRATVGRLAYSLHDRVNVVPIHFVYAGGWIYGRTARGGKLASILRNCRVAFEVDEYRGRFDWLSVVVHGPFYLLKADPGAKGEADGTALIAKFFPEASTEGDPIPFRDQFFRIHASEINGRSAQPG